MVAESDKPDSKQKAFVRAVRKLQEIGAIGIWGDYVWITGQAGQDRTTDNLSGGHQAGHGHPPKRVSVCPAVRDSVAPSSYPRPRREKISFSHRHLARCRGAGSTRPRTSRPSMTLTCRLKLWRERLRRLWDRRSTWRRS